MDCKYFREGKNGRCSTKCQKEECVCWVNKKISVETKILATLLIAIPISCIMGWMGVLKILGIVFAVVIILYSGMWVWVFWSFSRKGVR